MWRRRGGGDEGREEESRGEREGRRKGEGRGEKKREMKSYCQSREGTSKRAMELLLGKCCLVWRR